MFSFFKKKAEAPKSNTPPPLPTGNELEHAIIALKSGPWDPHKLIRGLVLSEAYLLLETPSDPMTYLILVADKIPHIAFFSSSARFTPAQKQHPGFIHPYKVSPWQFIKTLNDGVGFIINPYSPDCEYYAGTTHAAAIRDIFLNEPQRSGTPNA